LFVPPANPLFDLRRFMSWKVLITARVFNTVGKAALELLRSTGCEVIIPDQFGPYKFDKLLSSIVGMDATLCSPDAYNAQLLQSPQASALKIISRWGVGYDSIDVPTATREGIVVAYTPGLLNETVADWTWALLLAIARRIPQAHLAMSQGEWMPLWGYDVHGKTLGLVGCGRIGQAVAQRAFGFGMRVIAYDVNPPAGGPASNIEYVSLKELLAQSDFVSIHAALTATSRGLIGETELRQMKPTASLVNTARGPLLDEAALARALTERWIAGAALDVFTAEPLPAESPLRSAPNLVLAPHQASFARETSERVSLAAAQAIVDLMQGRKPRWVVDPGVYESPRLRAPIRG
jgi:phosphoglycerate dehydrogenase-like enzyme